MGQYLRKMQRFLAQIIMHNQFCAGHYVSERERAHHHLLHIIFAFGNKKIPMGYPPPEQCRRNLKHALSFSTQQNPLKVNGNCRPMSNSHVEMQHQNPDESYVETCVWEREREREGMGGGGGGGIVASRSVSSSRPSRQRNNQIRERARESGRRERRKKAGCTRHYCDDRLVFADLFRPFL